ncbi:hypothetical protein HDU76_013434 [Blyttiomyces sp. JEL0837]|nr:hypothetical protein HDU76_013434 [Blyttiomyces sp. JEL0837]
MLSAQRVGKLKLGDASSSSLSTILLFLLCSIFFITTPTVNAQSYHSERFSVYGKPIDSRSVRIRVEIYQDWIQWVGLGLGDMMDGADMMVFWTNDDGSVTISHRTGGPGHSPPTALRTTCNVACIRYSETGDKNPNNHDPTARLSPHAPIHKGMFKLSLIAPEADWDPDHPLTTQSFNSSTSATASATNSSLLASKTVNAALVLTPTTTLNVPVVMPLPTNLVVDNSTDDMNARSPRGNNTMVLAHGILMVVAWLILCPAGIAVARYFQDTWDGWLRAHVGFMFAGCVLLASIAFALIVVVTGSGSNQFNVASRGIHVVLGLVIIILMFVQGIFGFAVNKLYSPYRTRKAAWWEIGHRAMGWSILLAVMVNIPFGLSLYSNLYRTVPLAIWIIYAVWLAILAIVFGYLEGKMGPHGWFTKWMKTRSDVKRCSNVRDLTSVVPTVSGSGSGSPHEHGYADSTTTTTRSDGVQLPRPSMSQHRPGNGNGRIIAHQRGGNGGDGSVGGSFSGSFASVAGGSSTAGSGPIMTNGHHAISGAHVAFSNGVARSETGSGIGVSAGGLTDSNRTLTVSRVSSISEFSTILPPPEAAVAMFLKDPNMVSLDRLGRQTTFPPPSNNGMVSSSSTNDSNIPPAAATSNSLLRRCSSTRITAAEQRDAGTNTLSRGVASGTSRIEAEFSSAAVKSFMYDGSRLPDFSWFELSKEREEFKLDDDEDDELTNTNAAGDNVFADVDGNESIRGEDEQTAVFEVQPTSALLASHVQQGNVPRGSLENLVLGSLMAYRGLVTDSAAAGNGCIGKGLPLGKGSFGQGFAGS